MKTKATKRNQIQIPEGYMRIQLVTSYGHVVPLRKLDRKIYSEGEWTPFAVVLRKIGCAAPFYIEPARSKARRFEIK